MQREGHVDRDEHRTPCWRRARRSRAPIGNGRNGTRQGDVVRYSRGSKALGIEAGDYARVEHVDAKTNQVTVRTDDDRAVSYDPRRLQGVTLYRETERAFAAGDRVQMTAPDRERGVPEPGARHGRAHRRERTHGDSMGFRSNVLIRGAANAAISTTATP